MNDTYNFRLGDLVLSLDDTLGWITKIKNHENEHEFRGWPPGFNVMVCYNLQGNPERALPPEGIENLIQNLLRHLNND